MSMHQVEEQEQRRKMAAELRALADEVEAPGGTIYFVSLTDPEIRKAVGKAWRKCSSQTLTIVRRIP